MFWAWEKKTGTADARGQGVRAIAVAAWQTTFLSERLRLIRRTVALYRIRSSSARGGRVTMSVHVAPAVALRNLLRLRPEHPPLWHATSKHLAELPGHDAAPRHLQTLTGYREEQTGSASSRRASAGQWLITSYTLQRVSTGDKDPGIKPAEEVRGFVVDGFARCSNS